MAVLLDADGNPLLDADYFELLDADGGDAHVASGGGSFFVGQTMQFTRKRWEKLMEELERERLAAEEAARPPPPVIPRSDKGVLGGPFSSTRGSGLIGGQSLMKR